MPEYYYHYDNAQLRLQLKDNIDFFKWALDRIDLKKSHIARNQISRG